MATLLVTCVILLLSNLQIINAEGTHHKKNPLGFQGVRGKRNAESDLKKENYPNIMPNDDVTVTVSPEINGNEVRTNGIEENLYFRNFPDSVSLVKRAPSGFMGMRGKKDSEYTDFHKRALMELQRAMNKRFIFNYPLRFIPKRAPSGFMGMRGKKFIDDEYYSNDNKRAPSGFMGMRGKKDDNELWTSDDNTETYNNIDNNIELYERLLAERQLLNDIGRYYETENSLESSEDTEKRAPSGGFMGMRGKKYFDEDMESLDESLNKRTPSNGFFGMRGKKSYDNDFEEDKRAPMGFQGMRGKKDVSDVLQGIDSNGDKRGPVAGFLGMRGKKQPMGSYSGPRGKKPEFRGQFFGVRGKKNPEGSLKKLWLPFDDINYSELKSSSQFDTDDLSTNKRIPSGFVGMRGKKSSD